MKKIAHYFTKLSWEVWLAVWHLGCVCYLLALPLLVPLSCFLRLVTRIVQEMYSRKTPSPQWKRPRAAPNPYQDVAVIAAVIGLAFLTVPW